MDYISPESIVCLGSAVVSGSNQTFPVEPTSGGIQLPFIPG